MNLQTPPQDQWSQPPRAQPQQSVGLRTNTLAVISFVLAFIVPLIGLILGIIALVQINKNKERGRGLAVAGVAISAVYIVLTVAGAVMLFFFVSAGLEQEDRDTERKTDAAYIHAELQVYYNDRGYFPGSLSELDLADESLLSDSEGTPYNYDPAPALCNECESYVLSVELESGVIFRLYSDLHRDPYESCLYENSSECDTDLPLWSDESALLGA